MEIEDRDRPRLPHELDTRPDWTAALLQEASRHARYGRPASVVLIELQGNLRGDALDRMARRLADLIRSEARETDRAARVGAASFRMLLPETNARAARHVTTRLEQAFQVATTNRPDATHLRIELASPTRGGSLEDAILDAERRLGH
jgi:GGDEF domain-containing protein